MYDVYMKFNVYFHRLLTIPESLFLRKGIKDHLKGSLKNCFLHVFEVFHKDIKTVLLYWCPLKG